MPTASVGFRPASVMRYCAAMFWLVPGPAVEKLSLPGSLRIAACRSCTVFTGESARTAQMYGFSSSSDSMVNSFHLYGAFDSSAGKIACVAMRAMSSV
jgi:hypothetical protein